MDFIKDDLRRYIRTREIVALKTVITIARSLNIALMTLRNCGLVHLDLKPENVLVKVDTGQHRIFLSDFGHSLCTDNVLEQL